MGLWRWLNREKWQKKFIADAQNYNEHLKNWSKLVVSEDDESAKYFNDEFMTTMISLKSAILRLYYKLAKDRTHRFCGFPIYWQYEIPNFIILCVMQDDYSEPKTPNERSITMYSQTPPPPKPSWAEGPAEVVEVFEDKKSKKKKPKKQKFYDFAPMKEIDVEKDRRPKARKKKN